MVARLRQPSQQISPDTLVCLQDGPGQRLRQIEVTANTFVILARDAKDRFGVFEVDGVFDLTAAHDSARVEITQILSSLISTAEISGRAWGSLHAQILLLKVFSARTGFGTLHN